jgi:hypothetical protein
MSPNSQKGFIALFTVIIVSFTLLLLAITTNYSSLNGRINIYASENKARSAEIAYACIEQARLAFITENYSFGSVVPVTDIAGSEDSCNYIIASPNIIRSHACVNNSETFFETTFDETDSNLPLDSFKEHGNISGGLSTCP